MTKITFTTAEAAALAGVRTDYVALLCWDRQLPGARRVHNRWVIPERTLTRWLQRRSRRQLRAA